MNNSRRYGTALWSVLQTDEKSKQEVGNHVAKRSKKMDRKRQTDAATQNVEREGKGTYWNRSIGLSEMQVLL